MSKQVIAATILILIAGVSWSQEGQERKEGTHIVEKERTYSHGEFQLIPEFSFTNTIQAESQRLGTTFMVEFLFTLPVLPLKFGSIEALTDLLLDADSLEGIEYWSGGRKRMYPYIKKSYRVEEEESKKALPPLAFIEMNEGINYTHYQKDTSFGSNWYQVEVQPNDDSVMMSTLNITELKTFTKKTAGPEGVLIHMAIIPHDNETILYCAVSLKEFPSIGWSEGGVAGSFNHRISALEAWLADRVWGQE